MNHSKGFSLLELLIVVAIIGVLAAAGVVGYQSYTDTTKNNVLDSNMANTFKAAKTDIEALNQGLDDSSKLFEDVEKESDGTVTCESGAIEMVEYLNLNYANPHESTREVAAYGNASVDGTSGNFKSSINSMDRKGIIFVSCNDPAEDITDLVAVRLYQCGCETSTCTFTVTSNFDDPTVCPAPNESTSSAATASGSPFFGW